MRLVGEFPDIEAAVLAWLVADVPTVKWRTEQPKGWDPSKAGALPSGLIQTVPAGGDGEDWEDVPTVDLHLYAADRASLWPLVTQVKASLIAMQGNNGIDELVWSTRFGISPYENPAVRHAFGSIRLTTRAR